MDKTISIRKVRERGPAAFAWTFVEVPEGWIVKFGDTTLITENARHPRVFSNLTRAVSRLKNELGVTEFRVQAMKSPADMRKAA